MISMDSPNAGGGIPLTGGGSISNWNRHKNIVIGAICALSAVYSHVMLEHERFVSLEKAFLQEDEMKPLKYFFAHLWLWLVFLTSTLSTLRNKDEVWTLLHLCFAILTESLGLHCLTAEFCLAVSADTLEAVGIMETLLLTFLVFRLNRSITSVVEAVAIACMCICSRRYAGAVAALLLLLAEMMPDFRNYDFLAVAVANPLFSIALNGKGIKEFAKA